MLTMKTVYININSCFIITIIFLSAVNAASFRGREVVKAFNACANDTLKNIVESENCTYEVWENRMIDGPRKNGKIRYYALENNSCMALAVDQNFSVNIVRVVATAFLMPHLESRCYYNHRVILKYGGIGITMILHKYRGNRPDEYVHTFHDDETVPSEVNLFY